MLDVTDDGGVRVVTFDRPDARNAFNFALYVAVTEAVEAAATDESVRAVVLTGRGTVFTAGQDLKEMADIAAGTAPPGIAKGFQGLLAAVQRLDKPLLAAVNGPAVGLGFTVLAHCDLVLVAESARFRAPFAEMGVPPEASSSWLFPQLLGWQQAARVLLASEWVSADEAVAMGLALRVCPDDRVVDDTVALARRIATFPPDGVREIKRLMRAGRADAVAQAAAREERSFARLFATMAANDGVGVGDPDVSDPRII